VTHTKPSGNTTVTLADYDWTNNSANRVTTFNSLKDGLATYQYDSGGQVTHVGYSGAPAPAANPLPENYQYDDNGNRTAQGGGLVQVGLNNRTTSDGRYSYEYDDEDNRTWRVDNSSGVSQEYTWDYRQRLTLCCGAVSRPPHRVDRRFPTITSERRRNRRTIGDLRSAAWAGRETCPQLRDRRPSVLPTTEVRPEGVEDRRVGCTN
jgi:hypothetical protein